jgi:N-acetylmuramoyl-L-alanine amidase
LLHQLLVLSQHTPGDVIIAEIWQQNLLVSIVANKEYDSSANGRGVFLLGGIISSHLQILTS